MKYILTRKDGKPIPNTARFFVLRLDEHGSTDETTAARDAVAHYARAVRKADRDASDAAYRALIGPPEPFKYTEDGR